MRCLKCKQPLLPPERLFCSLCDKSLTMVDVREALEELDDRLQIVENRFKREETSEG